MDEICRQYWYPVYSYLRQRGHRAADAEDLTQSFFMHVLAKGVLEQARPERGRLRSFLLACLTHFVANERLHRQAQKRGGPPVAPRPSIDPRDVIEPSDGLTPERIYERQWAIMLLRRTLDELRGEFARAGKRRIFDALKPHLLGQPSGEGYHRLAVALSTTEGAARVAVHRLRRRFREILSDKIARTLHGSPAEVDDEVRYLFSVMQAPTRQERAS